MCVYVIILVWWKWSCMIIHFSISALSAALHLRHCEFVSIQLLRFVSEVLFVHFLRQLSFQSVSGNDFTVLPAVDHVTSFDRCSVAGLWDWVCDLLYGGSSWAWQGKEKEGSSLTVTEENGASWGGENLFYTVHQLVIIIPRPLVFKCTHSFTVLR